MDILEQIKAECETHECSECELFDLDDDRGCLILMPASGWDIKEIKKGVADGETT